MPGDSPSARASGKSRWLTWAAIPVAPVATITLVGSAVMKGPPRVVSRIVLPSTVAGSTAPVDALGQLDAAGEAAHGAGLDPVGPRRLAGQCRRRRPDPRGADRRPAP